MKTSWPHFSEKELACQHCGKTNPNPEFEQLMDVIQDIRYLFGPMPITSAYRCPDHPIEKAKSQPGQHSIAAVDVACYGADALRLLEIALDEGFPGIGIQQKGPLASRFIHLDLRQDEWLWSY